jgi:hypothetical protein
VRDEPSRPDPMSRGHLRPRQSIDDEPGWCLREIAEHAQARPYGCAPATCWECSRPRVDGLGVCWG